MVRADDHDVPLQLDALFLYRPLAYQGVCDCNCRIWQAVKIKEGWGGYAAGLVDVAAFG